MSKIIAIIQARMSSSRLPAKVIKPILGTPMLQHQINRIKHSKYIDELIVATSKNIEDKEIINLCKTLNIDFFSGSLNDVLDRFYQVADKYEATSIVRLTGDCPLIDVEILDKVINLHLKQNNDYTSNCLIPSFPDGLDVEVIEVKALKIAWEKAKKPSEREHVTPYIINNKTEFKLGNLLCDHDYSHLRWTVDEPLDFKLVTHIYNELYPTNNLFKFEQILKLIEQQPELVTINNEFSRNEGLKKSILRDRSLGYE